MEIGDLDVTQLHVEETTLINSSTLDYIEMSSLLFEGDKFG